MEFIAATNNEKKLAELRRILQREGHTVQGLQEAGIQLEPEETGDTFAENAYIKAAAVLAECGKPTIADDSGLEVDALNGAPGVHSARFAGAHGDDAANNQKLLHMMEHVPYQNRTARFVCSIALVLPDGGVLRAEGSCEGRIGFAPSGSGGFGYDPLFYVGDTSFAEMSPNEKDALSHRAKALHRLARELPSFLKKHRA